jgi:hypothetical protein
VASIAAVRRRQPQHRIDGRQAQRAAARRGQAAVIGWTGHGRPVDELHRAGPF